MAQKAEPGVSDAVAEAMAKLALSDQRSCSANVLDAAKAVIFDSVAVALAALPHRASLAARRYGETYKRGLGACTIIGASYKSDLETAALVNGVLMRCHDFNDLYVGAKSGGHPSDIVVGAIAAAEQFGRSGREALLAVAVGYEAMLTLFDALPVESRGFDYTNITMIGAVCAIGRLMALTFEQMKKALCIAATSHLSTNEIESGDLGDDGDLTLWKRFHGGEAIRQAAMSCQLASMDIEGALRAFTGQAGFLGHMGVDREAAMDLCDRFAAGANLSRVGDTTMKRWPVGSRAQSAIHAALQARRQIGDPRAIAAVRVTTNESAYDHMVRIRPHAWRPFSRETADHSLPYIVGAALLDGRVGPGSFDPQIVNDSGRLEFLKKIEVTLEPSGLSGRDQAENGYPSTIALRGENGSETAVKGEIPPGHRNNRFSQADLEDKLAECLASSGHDGRAAAVSEALWSLDRSPDLAALASRLAAHA